jgi:hypothetical protein
MDSPARRALFVLSPCSRLRTLLRREEQRRVSRMATMMPPWGTDWIGFTPAWPRQERHTHDGSLPPRTSVEPPLNRRGRRLFHLLQELSPRKPVVLGKGGWTEPETCRRVVKNALGGREPARTTRPRRLCFDRHDSQEAAFCFSISRSSRAWM